MFYRFSKIQFECTGCADCCKGQPGAYIFISETEISNIARSLQEDLATFIKTHIIVLEDGSMSLGMQDDGTCSFLGKDGKCGIYDVRPVQCQTYPFWPEIIASKKSWEREMSQCEGIGKGPVVSVAHIQKQLTLLETAGLQDLISDDR